MTKLDVLLKDINKKFKEDIASIGLPKRHIEKIPFTSVCANWLTYGGIPRGRIIEFAGEEGSGKTTTALDIVKNAQLLFNQEYKDEISSLKKEDKLSKDKQTRLQYLESSSPKRVVYIDCENTLDTDWALKLGVDVDDMIILKPQTQSAEEIFQIALDLIDTGEVGLMILDSLGVMVSQQAFDKSIEEKTYGGISQPLTVFGNKASSLCAKHNTTLIGINQVREDMANPYNTFKTPGGKGWKHMCSLRIIFSKGYPIDCDGNEIKKSALNPYGNKVQMSIAKTKVSSPERKLSYYTLTYNEGVYEIIDLVDLAISNNIIVQAGSWFTLANPETGEMLEDKLKCQGKPNVIKQIKEDKKLEQFIKQFLIIEQE